MSLHMHWLPYKSKRLSLGQPGFSKGMLTMHNVRFKASTNVFLNSTAFFFGELHPNLCLTHTGQRLKNGWARQGLPGSHHSRAAELSHPMCQAVSQQYQPEGSKWVGKEMSYPVLLDSLRNSPQGCKKAPKKLSFTSSKSISTYLPSIFPMSFLQWLEFLNLSAVFWTQPILQRTLPPSATETLPPHPSTSLTNFHSFDQPINQRRENAGENGRSSEEWISWTENIQNVGKNKRNPGKWKRKNHKQQQQKQNEYIIRYS